MAATTAATEILVLWPDQAAALDPFRFGWRYRQQPRPDGTIAFEQVPLTLEDVLHPEEDDFIAHSDAHERRCRYLSDVFDVQTAGDPTAVVLHDVRIAWDIPELKAHGPDVAVLFGVRERQDWGTFDVAVEGVRPALIVEITSPATASIDHNAKLDEYELAGVPFYVIVDALTPRRRPQLRLLGYTLGPNGYQGVAPDARGRLWLPPVRVWLGIEKDEIVCYDEADRPLGDYRVLAVARAEEAKARAAAEQRAETAEQRAEMADQRAETAEQRADGLASRLREMEAELRRARGEA